MRFVPRLTSPLRRTLLSWAWWLAQWGFWLLAWAGLTLVLVRILKDWPLLAQLTGDAHRISQIGLRLALSVPLAGFGLLLLHPFRATAWMRDRLMRAARRAERAAPAALAPAARAVRRPIERVARQFDPLPTPRPLSRRRFLSEAVVFGGLLGYSTQVEPYWLEITEVDLPVANLPERFIGMRIAQLSDMHTNTYTTAEDLARAVDAINAQRPDAVFLTGDFVDSDSKYADDATVPFARLNAPEGVFSVLGNHDYYTGDITRVRWAINRQDLGLLVNQHTVLRRGADTLTIVGLDDPKHDGRTRGLSMSSVDPARAMRGIAAGSPRLLLLHNPILVPSLVREYPIDAIFCGHTHGGQFRVPIITDEFVEATEYFVRGRYDLGRTQLYVNRGFGFTGPPLRFRVRPELTMLTLVRA
ncbi:MAG TPA: metallophosphoesterase [Herpetosiphonaceae bacterium]|nr:metallophosphoesterase [Herpetosiphonaceae bacterium]